MTIEKAINVLRGMELYLCSGNPIWKTDPIKEAVNMACEALKQTDTPQTELWDKKASDCDLWQKDRTCIGCYRYDICKQADTPQSTTDTSYQVLDGWQTRDKPKTTDCPWK